MSAAAGPQQADPTSDSIGSACIPIDTNIRLDSLEMRVRTLEESLARLTQIIDSIVDSIVDYIADNSGAR